MIFACLPGSHITVPFKRADFITSTFMCFIILILVKGLVITRNKRDFRLKKVSVLGEVKYWL